VAETTHNRRARAWNTSIQKLQELNRKLEVCEPNARNALERAIADQEDDVLDTPAPTYSALLFKLELLFEGQLEGLNTEAEQRRLVIEDLSDLIAETRSLIGDRA
jgi:hypothetical protein